jgi:aminoglycoside phosphotransferase (APT) family kinase protein
VTKAGEVLDRAGRVREGEELPAEALEAFLERELGLAGPVTVRQFGSGYSNLTYLVTAGEQEMVLRRPPVGSKVATAHDMSREYRVLSALHPVWPKAPEPLVLCDDPEVIGAPFYLMERVRGVILRSRLPRGLEMGETTARELSEKFVDTLAELHSVDVDAAGLADFGKPAGYVERQVEGWSKRWEKSKTDPVPEIDAAAGWLAESLPEDRPETACLVHNDFKYDNLVLGAEALERGEIDIDAVLDWEMATLGDPLLDLGTSLGYWVEAGDPEPLRQFRFGPTDLPGSLSRREIVERYAETTGREIENAPFYYVFGLFKIAVIAQQIYYRYQQGLTKDERFAMLLPAIRVLGGEAGRVMGSGKV